MSLPLLSLLWQVVRPVMEKAEERFKRWTKPAPCTLIEGVAADLIRTKSELMAENALLRLQLIVLERLVKQPAFMPFDRGLLVVLASHLPRWKQALPIVKTAPLLQWHGPRITLLWLSQFRTRSR